MLGNIAINCQAILDNLPIGNFYNLVYQMKYGTCIGINDRFRLKI